MLVIMAAVVVVIEEVVGLVVGSMACSPVIGQAGEVSVGGG